MAAFGRREVATPQPASARPLDELAALREQFLASERARRAELATRHGEMSDVATNFDDRLAKGKVGASAAASTGDRSLGVAYGLWLALSPFAAHRFYLGAVNSAYLQTGIFLIGAAILLLAPAEAQAVTFFGILCLLGWGCWVLADALLTARLFNKREAGEKMAGVFL